MKEGCCRVQRVACLVEGEARDIITRLREVEQRGTRRHAGFDAEDGNGAVAESAGEQLAAAVVTAAVEGAAGTLVSERCNARASIPQLDF